MSSGRSERRSTTSAWMSCSAASRSATCSARTVAKECETIVRSEPVAGDVGLADRGQELGVVGDLALLLVDRQVLDHQHRVVVADGALEQALGVARGGRRDHLEAGHVGEPPVEGLRVLGRELIARPVGRADDHRALHQAAEHVVDLGGVVDDLVHGHQDEVERHDLHDRALAEHGGPDRGAHEAFLGDRRVADAIGPPLLQQPGGDLVGAVEDADLLAHEKDGVVALELLAQRHPERLAVGHPRRARRLGSRRSEPRSKTSSLSPNGEPGRMRANCCLNFGSA